jgi:hypothetical protein
MGTACEHFNLRRCHYHRLHPLPLGQAFLSERPLRSVVAGTPPYAASPSSATPRLRTRSTPRR